MKGFTTLAALLILSVCSLGCETTSVPTTTPTATFEPTPGSTATPRYSQNEVISLVEDYLLARAETRLAHDIVQMKVTALYASYRGDGFWEVGGNGEWRVYEASGTVEPIDEEAWQILESIADANQAPAVYAITRVTPSVVRVVTPSGGGSGVIIDQAGYILTNNHVVEDTLSVTVDLSTGEQYRGIVIGRDEIRDIAIVKITADNLTAATLGDSSELRVGEGVISMGFPLLLDGSVTATEGIVSAFQIDSETGIRSIQTDAAMNPGSSGGPLINLTGEVVGVNCWVIRVSGNTPIEGVNFAIAINDVKDIIPRLMAGESILAPVEESWETYTNGVYGYSILYPASWKVDDLNLKYVRICHRSYEVGADIATITEVSPTATVEGLVDANIRRLQTDYPDFKLLYREEVTHSGLSGWEIAYTYTEGVGWYFRHFFARAGSSMYHIRVWTEQSEYELYSTTIDDIIGSFHL